MSEKTMIVEGKNKNWEKFYDKNFFWGDGKFYQNNILSKEFVHEFIDKINFVSFSMFQELSEDMIREFKDKVDWFWIFTYQNLSEAFIAEFSYKADENENCWRQISKNQKLYADFITMFSDKVDWEYISKYQKLSEDMIREFSDKVDWIEISKHQKLSEDFIKEFRNELDLDYIIEFQKHLTNEFISELIGEKYPRVKPVI